MDGGEKGFLCRKPFDDKRVKKKKNKKSMEEGKKERQVEGGGKSVKVVKSPFEHVAGWVVSYACRQQTECSSTSTTVA